MDTQSPLVDWNVQARKGLLPGPVGPRLSVMLA
jgi:hypothetical protein